MFIEKTIDKQKTIHIESEVMQYEAYEGTAKRK